MNIVTNRIESTDEYQFEKNYWGNCCNTFDEDQKHYVYARYMGLSQVHYSFDVFNRAVLDIGGGPTSMLLKCINLKRGKVVDPIQYPRWTVDRYRMNNIEVEVNLGENVSDTGFDEVWIYNCLQHVHDVQKLIANAKRSAKVLRIFEWINIPPHEGHPIELTESLLNELIGQQGKTVQLAESGCYGTAYYGYFIL